MRARNLNQYPLIILWLSVYRNACYEKLIIFSISLYYRDHSFVLMTNYTVKECLDSCFNKKYGRCFSSIHSPQTCHSDKGGITSKGSIVLFPVRVEIQSVPGN
jgi:hypothetical protein